MQVRNLENFEQKCVAEILKMVPLDACLTEAQGPCDGINTAAGS